MKEKTSAMDYWLQANEVLFFFSSIEEIKEEAADMATYFVDNTASYFGASPSMPKAPEVANTPKRPETPRSLAKVNTRGMKPLTSFFKKK